MSDYNYDSFSATHYELDSFGCPTPGQKAPDFSLQTVDGTKRDLLDFEGEFLVLELGSITCPLFQSRRGGMDRLTAKYPNASFAILYVREAHPGTMRPQHQNEDDKVANARALKLEDNEGRLILIDDIAGTAHKAYGSFPNAVFIINRNGCILYYSDWNNSVATGKALKALTAGRPAPRMAPFQLPRMPIALGTLQDAGKGASVDFFKSLPTLMWKNLVLRNLRLMRGKTPNIPPDANC